MRTLSAHNSYTPTFGFPRFAMEKVVLPPKMTPAEQCDRDWPFWRELLGTMLNGGKQPARAKLAAAREAVEAGEMERLKLLAHAMKGSAATMCLSQLTLLCAELQRSAQLGEEASALTAQLAAIEDLLYSVELSWRWACSLGEAELCNALEQVGGYWEALGLQLTQPR